MNNLEKMQQQIYDSNIRIDNIILNFATSIYLNFKGIECIGIDYSKINNQIEEYCILAHELAHKKTGTVYNIKSNEIEARRAEFRADKFMINEIIPFNRLKSFIVQNRVNYAYEIADEFGVTEDIINKALKIYCLI